jgi:hypothetical protein
VVYSGTVGDDASRFVIPNGVQTSRFSAPGDAADDAAVIRSLDTLDIRRQERPDPLPLLVAEPKQIPANDFKSFPPKNHYFVVSAEGLMSSDPVALAE